MELSIIIPVYNVEKYIEKCLESIYNQGADKKRFEVIVVNDGTKDHSIERIQPIIDHNDNCILINQDNQGLSVARNTGLKNAKGNYVWFVDSDDQLAPEALNPVLDLLKERKEDIIAFNVLKRDEVSGADKEAVPFVNMSRKCFFDHSYTGEEALGMFHKGLVQRYIIRRDFLFDKKLYFLPGVWYEDDQLLVRLFCFVKDLYVSSIYSYIYLIRKSGSIMTSTSIKSINDSFVLIESWKSFKNDLELIDLMKHWVDFNIFRYYYFILSHQESRIDGYSECLRGKWIEVKRKMIWYAIKSGSFLSVKLLIKSLILCVCPHLLLRRHK